MSNVTNEEEKPKKASDTASNGLTGIPEPIHCPATRNESEAENELDEIAVERFLETLAAVALSIAARESDGQKD